MRLLALLLMTLPLCAACERSGPLERAGEEIDETLEDIRDGAETLRDDAEDAIDEAREESDGAATD